MEDSGGSGGSSWRAILFTHLGKQKLNDYADLGAFCDQRVKFFESCLRCANVSVVYVYSSYGIEYYVQAVTAKSEGTIPLEILDTEQRINNAVQIAIKQANTAMADSTAKARPKFVFIGVRELATHLSRLHRIDQNENIGLIDSLASAGKFTYDSPKFVEAIIRLIRANEPVLRVDADVEVDEVAIQKLLDTVRQEAARRYYWFSGCYSGNYDNDVVNEFAVRVHWLVHEENAKYVLPDNAVSFLVDLAEIGATQLVPETANPALDSRLSEAARRMINERRGGISKNRRVPQVISGAGLIASHHAIERLPPFMNAPEMVVWIDDYLKRVLHERIGDLTKRTDDLKKRNVERVSGASLKQERYPSGITKQDIAFCAQAPPDQTPYFKRLLNGCLMEATIENPDGTDGPLALAVKEVVDNAAPYRKVAPALAHNGPPYTGDLGADLMAVAEVRFDDVMAIWRNADAEYGNNILGDWARAFTDRQGACELVAQMGIDYVKLCRLWQRHRLAIADLGELEAYWVHERRSVRRSP